MKVLTMELSGKTSDVMAAQDQGMCKAVLPAAACNAFTIAFLLTGDIARAEGAVLEAIESLPAGAASPEAILFGTVVNSVGSAGDQKEMTAGTPGWGGLPRELRGLLRLGARMRSSFVLRRLVKFSAVECARLLGIPEQDVEADASMAMWRLAENHQF